MRGNRDAGHRRESGGGDEAFIGGRYRLPRWRTGSAADAIRIDARRPGLWPRLLNNR